MPTEDHAPVWARQDAFPPKPTSGAFGFIDTKGNEVEVDSETALIEKIEKSRQGVDLVWSPESEFLVAPEEIVALRGTLWNRRRKWAEMDCDDGKRMGLIFLAVVLWYMYSAYQRNGGDVKAALLDPTAGIAGIMLLMFGLVPLYNGWKTLRKGKPSQASEWQEEVDDARFDSWLSNQKTPISYVLLGLIVVTGLVQIYIERSIEWGGQSVFRGGLLKTYNPAMGGGEWWRYLTAPLLHGNALHWVMNAAALKYLASRTESLARWPHVVIVFMVSAWVGGMATMMLVPQPSVGASGGIMGLLGFLLVFETLHTKLVPKTSRRRLIAGVVITALMGIFGFQFIDNAAHAGGLIAGMAYAAIVFPKSKTPHRPSIMQQDKAVATAALAVCLLAVVMVLVKVL